MNEFFDLPWRERLAIEIRLACEVAGIGKNSLIGLLKSEEIKSVKIAGRRLVVVSSLKAYVEQAAQRSFEEGKRPAPPRPAKPRGRPRKAISTSKYEAA